VTLFGLAGELGAGKTLTLTYLAWKNWFMRRRKIYSNYHLFKIPYILVQSFEAFDKMKEGFVAMDELWRLIDSRASLTLRNRVTANILAKSRKRGLIIAFTVQVLDSIDKRVRKIMDFTAYPILNATESICKVVVFRTGYPKAGTYMKTFYFRTPLIFECYDTNEEIEPWEDDAEFKELIVFQPNFNPEHGYLCECEKCGTKLFKSWEEADKYAESYWRKAFRTKLGLI